MPKRLSYIIATLAISAFMAVCGLNYSHAAGIRPSNGATDVDVSTTISVPFSEAMNKAATEGAFSISPVVAGTFSWDGNTMIFKPAKPLTYGTRYTCVIGTAASDLAGNTMTKASQWSFTTQAAIIRIAVSEPPDGYAEKKSELYQACAREYLALAKWCLSNNLPQEAADHLQATLEYDPGNNEAAQELAKEPAKITPAKISDSALDAYDQKSAGLKKKLAEEHAKFGLWYKQKNLPEEAGREFDTALDLFEDQPAVRKELNQVKVPGFGWVGKDAAANLAKGLRECQGRWLPKSEAEKIRGNWDQAWDIRTRHYLVRTNNTPEQGYELAQAAEDLYQMFSTVFGRLLELNKPDEPMTINYLKSEAEYEREFRRAYNDPVPASAVYRSPVVWLWGPSSASAGQFTEKNTMYHEVTHQLTDLVAPSMAETWLQEGLACYFETLSRNKSGRLVGGSFNPQRNFTMVQNPVPLAEFASAKNKDMAFYAQSSALVTFFLNNPGGQKYRENFLDYFRGHFIDPEFDSPKALEKCFANIDLKTVDGEFLAWAKKGQTITWPKLAIRPKPESGARPKEVRALFTGRAEDLNDWKVEGHADWLKLSGQQIIFNPTDQKGSSSIIWEGEVPENCTITLVFSLAKAQEAKLGLIIGADKSAKFTMQSVLALPEQRFRAGTNVFKCVKAGKMHSFIINNRKWIGQSRPEMSGMGPTSWIPYLGFSMGGTRMALSKITIEE